MSVTASHGRAFDLRRLDLNLVVPLHAVLVERSVSRAARRVGLTQPAVSKSLQKLRQHFADDLLVRTGRTSVLTPFAQTLLPEVEDLVRRLGDVLTPGDTFDPALTRRDFSLAASDYFAAVLGQALVSAMDESAPSASLHLVDLADPRLQGQPDSVDGIVLPPGIDIGLVDSAHLLTDEWSLVVDPRLAGEAASWTSADLARRHVVAASIGGQVPARTAFSRMGVDVDVRVVAPTFGAVPFLVAGTDRVGLIGRRQARRLAPAAGVVVLDPAWPLPVVHYQLFSDPVRGRDAGTRWFLDLVQSVARAVDAR